MLRTLWIAALVLTSACIVPKHTHTKRVLATERGTPVVVNPPPELVVTVDAPRIRVLASRACRAPTTDLVEDTLHVTTDVVGASVVPARPGTNQENQGEGSLLALIALASGLVTAVDIVANDGKVKVTRERGPDEEAPCLASVRQIVVEIDLPSGLKITARTDDTGGVELVIPDSEPASGELTVHAAGMAPIKATYRRP